MFYSGHSILAGIGRAESLPTAAATPAQAEWAWGEARRWLDRPLAFPPLSERLEKPEVWRRVQRERRQALEALLRVPPEERVLRRINDLTCAISEESAWAEDIGGALFDDEGHPAIDFQCAETAMLFAWTVRTLGGALDARAAAKMLYEVRRRVFSPFLAHQDYPFMRGKGFRPLCVLSDIVLCALILETDGGRRAAIEKLALRQIDQVINWRARRLEPLADAAGETAAITDLAVLLRRATRGELNETRTFPTAEWLDGLLFPWLEGDYFLDPGVGDMRPAISGAELFRVGLTAGDDALTALGARLHLSRHLPSSTLTGRVLDLDCAAALAAEQRKAPRLKQAATPNNRIMVSRFGGFTFGMHANGLTSAGGVVMFYRGRPILVETPDAANLPRFDGHRQLFITDTPCEADFELRPDREAMSVELTRAYPAGCHVRSYQRTAMIMRPDGAVRDEGMLRLVEALELTVPGHVTFHFLTPEKPLHQPDGLRVDGLDLNWDGGLTAEIRQTDHRFPRDEADGAPLYDIALSTPAPVTRAFFAFVFAPAQD